MEKKRIFRLAGKPFLNKPEQSAGGLLYAEGRACRPPFTLSPGCLPKRKRFYFALYRQAGILLFAFATALCLSVTAQAMTAVDDFRQKDEIPNAVYINLAEISQGYRNMTGWMEAPDNTACMMQSAKQSGAAVYYASGVREIEIDIYSRYGTFAVAGTSGPSGLGFGIKDELSIGLPKIPMYLSGSEVYTSYDKVWYKMLLNSKSSQYEFVPAPPPESTEQYGLSVYSSQDGTNLNALNAKQTYLMTNSLATYPRILSCFERYTAQIPANAKYIMIYLNDFSKVETTAGIVLPQESGNKICLAQVRFKGDNISFSPPAAETSSTAKDQESSSKDKPNAKKGQSSKSAPKSGEGEKSASKPSKTDTPDQSRYDDKELRSREDNLHESVQKVFSEAGSRNYKGSGTDKTKAMGIALIIGGSAFLAWRIITIFFIKRS